MKKLILSQLFISILFITTSFGQTEKGNFLLGGNASLRIHTYKLVNLNSYKTFNFNPTMGYFIINNLALGIKTPLFWQGHNTDDYDFRYGVSAFSRYYFLKTDKTSFFGSANFGLVGYKSKQLNTYTNNGYNAGVGLGFAFFLNKNIGFETEVLYDYSTEMNDSGNDNFDMNFGFQIYFNKQKK